jgi:citrate synthase
MKDIRTQWKALAAAKEITCEDIAALCLYRTLFNEQQSAEAKSRLHKSFSPIKNEIKLANGAQPYDALVAALRTIKYSHVAQWLDEEDRVKMLGLAKETLLVGIK